MQASNEENEYKTYFLEYCSFFENKRRFQVGRDMKSWGLFVKDWFGDQYVRARPVSQCRILLISYQFNEEHENFSIYASNFNVRKKNCKDGIIDTGNEFIRNHFEKKEFSHWLRHKFSSLRWELILEEKSRIFGYFFVELDDFIKRNTFL